MDYKRIQLCQRDIQVQRYNPTQQYQRVVAECISERSNFRDLWPVLINNHFDQITELPAR